MAAPEITDIGRSVFAIQPARTYLSRIEGFRRTWDTWRTRRRYRKSLLRLLRAGTYLIEDIGLTPEEARREIEKPFWQA